MDTGESLLPSNIVSQHRLQGLYQGRQVLLPVPHYAVVGCLENRGAAVLVHRDDDARFLDTNRVVKSAADSYRQPLERMWKPG